MTAYLPGPYQLKISYIVDGLDHQHTFSIDLESDPTPGTEFADINAIRKDAAVIDLATSVDAIVALLVPYHDDTTEFTVAELSKYVVGTYATLYRASYDISENGTSAGDYTPTKQVTQVYRSSGGSILKLQMHETTGNNTTSQVAMSSLTSFEANLRDYMTSTACIIKARDGGYAVAGIRQSNTLNEKTYERRYRS